MPSQMRRRMHAARTATIWCALLMVTAAACSSREPGPSSSATAGPSPSQAPAPSPTDQPAPSPTEPTRSPAGAPVDPAVIPAEEALTLAYAQAVIDALDEQLGATARLAVAEGVDHEAVVARLSSIYGGEAYATAIAGWRDYLAPRFGDAPGAPETTVTEVVTATPTCLSVRAARSLDPFGPEVEFSGSDWFLALQPREGGSGDGNPTAWRITFEGLPAAEDVEVHDPCAG